MIYRYTDSVQYCNFNDIEQIISDIDETFCKKIKNQNGSFNTISVIAESHIIESLFYLLTLNANKVDINGKYYLNDTYSMEEVVNLFNCCTVLHLMINEDGVIFIDDPKRYRPFKADDLELYLFIFAYIQYGTDKESIETARKCNIPTLEFNVRNYSSDSYMEF